MHASHVSIASACLEVCLISAVGLLASCYLWRVAGALAGMLLRQLLFCLQPSILLPSQMLGQPPVSREQGDDADKKEEPVGVDAHLQFESKSESS